MKDGKNVHKSSREVLEREAEGFFSPPLPRVFSRSLLSVLIATFNAYLTPGTGQILRTRMGSPSWLALSPPQRLLHKKGSEKPEMGRKTEVE